MSGFEFTEVLIPKTGRLKNIYKYKGKVCYRIPLHSQIAQQLAGLKLIEKDLRNVLVWLKEIAKKLPSERQHKHGHFRSGDREDFNLVKGLFIAALTVYAKAYTTCDGRKTKLNKKNLDEKFRKSHDEVMAFRNNYAAHSGSDQHEYVNICLVIDSSKKRETPPQIVSELSQPDTLDREGVEEFIQLAEHVREKVLSKYEKTRQRILTDEIIPKGLAHWQKFGKKIS